MIVIEDNRSYVNEWHIHPPLNSIKLLLGNTSAPPLFYTLNYALVLTPWTSPEGSTKLTDSLTRKSEFKKKTDNKCVHDSIGFQYIFTHKLTHFSHG